MKPLKPLSLVAIIALIGLTSNASYAVVTGDTSFTPTSVVIPVTEITLKNTDGNNSLLYTCSGSMADCCVDISDASALAALSANASINAGTYDRIAVGTCRDEGNYDATITGTFIRSSTNYYTTTPANPVLWLNESVHLNGIN